jgi:hypothetical protein
LFKLNLFREWHPSSLGLPPRLIFLHSNSYVATILKIRSLPLSNLRHTLTTPNTWLVLNCPLCGFRFPLRKFDRTLTPIHFPLGFACSRGRARGFATVKRLPWAALPSLQNTWAWNSVLSLYGRLAAAYDHFYETLGFLSPKIEALIQELQTSYAHTYLPAIGSEYLAAYRSSASDIAEAYSESDYPQVYANSQTRSIERRPS